MDSRRLQSRRAAPQQMQVTMPLAALRPLWTDHPPWPSAVPTPTPMSAPEPRKFVIQGTTRDGKAFRPSDWAERLAGAMSSFRPEGSATGMTSFIGYSPLCVPRVVGGVRSIIVDETLRSIEPMAWDFVMNFARDNNLVVIEPEVPPSERAASVT